MNQAPPRPRFKHAMTATAVAWIQARNAWRAYFKALLAKPERRGLDRGAFHMVQDSVVNDSAFAASASQAETEVRGVRCTSLRTFAKREMVGSVTI